MPCEAYKERLTDAAANGSALAQELRAHVEACSACLAFFADEQQLFAAIDSGVRASANAEVPPSLLGRIRAGLNEQQVPRRSWFPLGAAFASAALVLAVILFARGYGRHNSGRNASPSPVASLVAPAEAAGIPTRVVAPRNQAARLGSRERSPRVAAASAVPSAEVRVLLPAGQKEAVDALLIALRTGAVNGDILVAGKVEKPSQGGELSPLSISPIEIQPLAPVSEESAPDREKTSR